MFREKKLSKLMQCPNKLLSRGHKTSLVIIERVRRGSGGHVKFHCCILNVNNW